MGKCHENVVESGLEWFEREGNGLVYIWRQEGGLASRETESERAGRTVKGEYLQVDAKLDPKGRLVLPAKLRRRLQADGIDSLVLMIYPNFEAIFAFTVEDWNRKVVEPLDEAFVFDPDAMMLAHALIGGAQSVDIDKQGRMLIPPKMRAEAELDRELVLQTLPGRLEIWSSSAWASRKAEAIATFNKRAAARKASTISILGGM